MTKICVVLCSGLLLLGLGAAPAGAESEADRELEFISGLIRLGFPDYADKLMAKMIKEDPGAQERLTVVKIRMLIANRKFAEAETLLKNLPANDPQTPASWMAVAGGYLQIKDLEKASRIYTEFLNRFTNAPPPAGATNENPLLDVAYRLAQIQEKRGDFLGAIKAYDRVMAMTGKDEKSLHSKLQMAQAHLYFKIAQATNDNAQITANLEAANKICKAILWRGVDLYFCQAVLLQAQMDLLKGDQTAARKKVMDNLAVFKKMDEEIQKQTGEDKLPISLSPLAGASFILGQIDQTQGEAALGQNKEEGKKLLLQALASFNLIVAKYRESEWTPEATARVQAVREKLKEAGVAVGPDPATTTLPAMNTALQSQIKVADNLFYNQTNYAQAQTEYLTALNGHPDTTNTPRLLMNLARCYYYQDDKRMAKVAAQYLGERFAGDLRAGNMLLQIGKTYSERKDLEMLAGIYATFLDNFPKHDSVPAVLYSLALISKKKGDEAGAAGYMQRLITEFPNDPNYLKALDQTAWAHYKEKKYEQAQESFKKFIAENRDEQLKPQALFGLANCYLAQEQFEPALKEFKAAQASFEARLADKEKPPSAEQQKSYKEMLEQTLYLGALCYSKIDTPAAAVPTNQDAAIALADKLLTDYPKSGWAPRTMNLKGTLQLSRGQLEAAVATFNNLATAYPESLEGKNALVTLIQAALNVKKYDVARESMAKMVANRQFYLKDGKESIFAFLGRAMFDAGQYPEAIGAYQVLTNATVTNLALLENTYYYLGRAYGESANHTGAVAALTTLLTRFPNSGFYYDAKFALARSYRGLGKYSLVNETLGDIARRATNNVMINKASLELSKAQLADGKKKEALASLMRITMFADHANPELRPILEEAYALSFPLLKELEKREDLIDTCRQYLTKFPQGTNVALVNKFKQDAELLPVAPAP